MKNLESSTEVVRAVLKRHRDVIWQDFKTTIADVNGAMTRREILNLDSENLEVVW